MDYFGHNSGDDSRALLLAVYRTALAAVEGRRCVSAGLAQRPLPGPVYAVALGKAAASMLDGALDALGDQLRRALLVTKRGHAPARVDPRIEVQEAGHPIPDAASLAAGQRLLDFLATVPVDAGWLFLISGGASSLVEVLPDGVELPEVQRLNAWLLASGLPIEQINLVRQAVSRIKGGRLLNHLSAGTVHALFISDVPGDDPSIIGSGLLHRSSSATAMPQLPSEFAAMSNSQAAVAPLAASHVETQIVANLDQALAAAQQAAAREGLPVHLHPVRLSGDATEVGRRLARELLDGMPGVHLWGGETTVALPERPGQGGRCQQLALAAAEILDGYTDIVLLAAGTDGNDGPGESAGACIDAETVLRGRHAGLDSRRALADADAGRFLEAAGDLIETGPTGTNVTDLVLALKMNSGVL